MNKTLFLIPFCLGSVFADNHIESQLKILQKKNQEQAALISSLSKELEDLDEKVENVETATLLDKIKLNLDFKVKMNNYDKKLADDTHIASHNLVTTKFMLGMYSDITETMKFHARASMFKYWADSTKHPYSYFDNMQGRAPSDSGLYIERAYVDWHFTAGVPSAITLGRLPSADGPSHQFIENTSRKSTYSALVFDGASDGIDYTADISTVVNIKNAKIRIAYGKGFQNDETRNSVENAFTGAGVSEIKDTDVMGGFFESNLFSLENSLFQVGYFTMQNVIANPMESDTKSNKNIGDIDFLGAMGEVTDIKKSGLDAFIHIGYSKAVPNKELYRDYFGLLRDATDSASDKEGYAFWLGGRYTFENLNQSKIGFEYNHGSKNWVSATQGSYNTANKLATRGNAAELYGLYPINRYSFIKLGVLYIDYDYTNSGHYLSRPKKISTLSELESSSATDTLQNIYLQFSVKF